MYDPAPRLLPDRNFSRRFLSVTLGLDYTDGIQILESREAARRDRLSIRARITAASNVTPESILQFDQKGSGETGIFEETNRGEDFFPGCEVD